MPLQAKEVDLKIFEVKYLNPQDDKTPLFVKDYGNEERPSHALL